jgi:hypothetical protein
MNWEDEIAEREAAEFIAEAHRSLPEDTALDFCRRVLATNQAGVWVGDGGETLLDSFSASAVVAVHDKLSEAGQAKLARWPLVHQVATCFAVIRKAEGR